MKLSDLKQALFQASEFSSANSLAMATGQTQPFTAAFLDSSKEAHEKEDILFEALTKGITVDELMAALELVSTVRRQLIEKECFVISLGDEIERKNF